MNVAIPVCCYACEIWGSYCGVVSTHHSQGSLTLEKYKLVYKSLIVMLTDSIIYNDNVVDSLHKHGMYIMYIYLTF